MTRWVTVHNHKVGRSTSSWTVSARPEKEGDTMGAFDPPILFEKGTYIGRLRKRHVRADKQRPIREVRRTLSWARPAIAAAG